MGDKGGRENHSSRFGSIPPYATGLRRTRRDHADIPPPDHLCKPSGDAVSLPYYKRFPRDFLDGTIGLCLETKGAYAIVLDLIYMRDGRLADDARYIAGQLGCSVRKWTAIRKELFAAGKIQCANGIISNFRADYLTEESRKYQDNQREIAGLPRKNNTLRQPKPSQSESESDIQAIACIAREDAFQDAFDAYPESGRGISSRPAALKAWREACAIWSPDDLLAAIKSYASSPDLKKRDYGAPKFERWLGEERWRTWMVSRAERQALTVPLGLWKAVSAATSPSFADSYLSGAIVQDGALIAKTKTAFNHLTASGPASSALDGFGLTAKAPCPQSLKINVD